MNLLKPRHDREREFQCEAAIPELTVPRFAGLVAVNLGLEN